MNQHLSISYALTEQDIDDIHQLEDRLRDSRGIRYKLDLLTSENTSATNAHILCREGGRLTGYVALNYFGHDELEMTAMMEDANRHFQDVHHLAVDKCAEIGARRLLLINDRRDHAMASLAADAGTRLSFTEYRMSFQGHPPTPDSASGIILRSATPADSGYIAGLDDDSFHNANEPTSDTPIPPQDLANTRITERNGERIGKIRVDECDGVFGIYGFVIAPEHRGKGYGRIVLNEALRHIMQRKHRKIYLEVAADNTAALHLYESSGFLTDAAFDYFEQSLLC